MLKTVKNSLLLLLVVALAGCAGQTTQDDDEMAEVSGQVFYVERIAAPPNARLEVVLEDISRQDVAAERLGEMVIEPAGQPPYEFSIEYDPAQIDPRHSYRVAARLYDGQDLLFTSDTVHQVLTRGFPATASVRMRRVARRPDQLLGSIPAAFAGTLPSAGPGVETQIHLLENGVYFLRETHLARDNGTFDDIGRYLVSSDRKQLSLHGGREAPLRFAIEGPDALEMLDRDGARIDSELNYTLERKPQLALPEPRLLMGGKFRYLAGAGRFRECLTGLDLAVAAEEDNRALEEAYLEAREEPGEELKVSLEGRIEQRPSAEGSEPVMTLVPERFIGVWPGQDCPPRAHAASLENTYWRLVLLGDSGVERFPNQREPHLVFRETGEVGGSDGCNRLSGRYRSTGGSIEFSELVTTRKMCVQGMEQAETFVQTLSVANHVRVIGQHLEVLDEANNLLMRLEAVAL